MEYPLYEILFTETEFKVSLVEVPASDINFIALSKVDGSPVSLDFEKIDEYKRIVTGVALRANYPILRNNGLKKGLSNDLYYVMLSTDTIEQYVHSFMKNGILNNVNINHLGNDISDVYLFESYLKDGNWHVSYKIENDEVWTNILGKKINGFSPEFLGLLSDTNKFINNVKMSKKQLAKLKISFIKKYLTQGFNFDKVTTSEGITVFYDDLEVGADAWLDDYTIPADGEYADDNVKIVIKDGKIESFEKIEEESEDGDNDELKSTVEMLSSKITDLEAKLDAIKFGEVSNKVIALEKSIKEALSKAKTASFIDPKKDVADTVLNANLAKMLGKK